MDSLCIAGRAFNSRLMVGTGKFASHQAMVEALQHSAGEIVTVALRRVDIDNPQDSLLSHIDRRRYLLLPNTSGARNADEAVRLAHLARAAGCEPWVKLEVTPDPYYLLPDPIETLKAAEHPGQGGLCRAALHAGGSGSGQTHLEEAGTATVMPLGAPIGTNRGVQNPGTDRHHHRTGADVPVVVDAGLGSPIACCRSHGNGSRCRPGQHGPGRHGQIRQCHGAERFAKAVAAGREALPRRPWSATSTGSRRPAR